MTGRARRRPGPPDPAQLRAQLDTIGAELFELRRRASDLGHEYIWLDTATLDVQGDSAQHLSTEDALRAARDSFDDLANALGIATDSYTVATRHLDRLTLRNQH